MEYFGIDVHTKASVWCLLGEDGEVRARGRVETAVPALGELVTELSRREELGVGVSWDYALAQPGRNGPVQAWVVDDTACPKMRCHSVGVAPGCGGAPRVPGHQRCPPSVTKRDPRG